MSGIRKCVDVESHTTVLRLSGRDLITLHNAVGWYLKNHQEGEHEIECEDCLENAIDVMERLLNKCEVMENEANERE